jgi:hypothetical protein
VAFVHLRLDDVKRTNCCTSTRVLLVGSGNDNFSEGAHGPRKDMKSY